MSENRIKHIEGLKRDYDAIRPALKTLQASPDDAAANFLVGRYHFYLRGDPLRGLPMLAKGSDLRLKDLASRDLANHEDTSEQLLVANGWFDLAESEAIPAKGHLQGRAKLWFQKALPDLTGDELARVKQRLALLP